MLATTESHATSLVHSKSHRHKFGTGMGAVAKGLLLRFTAGAPGVLPRLKFHNTGLFIGNYRFVHRLIL
jgi:hypothetical protein